MVLTTKSLSIQTCCTSASTSRTCSLAPPLARQALPRVNKRISSPSLTSNRRCTIVRAAEDSELELAVFRFTLGIPGFDDTFIPRVVGGLGLLLLLGNHLLGPDTSLGAQTRSEILAAVLAALCIASPTIEARLKELEPGRGRQAAPQQVQGATSVFAISDAVSEKLKQELAWASYALLRNTNTCGVLAYSGKQAVMARGAIGLAGSASADKPSAQACLERLSEEYGSIKSQDNAASSADTKQVQYLQDKGAISSSKAYSSSGIAPAGAQSILVCENTAAEYGSDLLLIMLSDRPRAWSRRERAWGRAVSQKLSQTMG